MGKKFICEDMIAEDRDTADTAVTFIEGRLHQLHNPVWLFTRFGTFHAVPKGVKDKLAKDPDVDQDKLISETPSGV